MEKVIVALVTARDRDEAERIAESLVDERLAACVNVIEGVTSIYRWQGGVQKDREVLLLAKTTDRRAADLERRVRELHSYDVPEVLILSSTGGSQSYLDWVRAETAVEDAGQTY